MADQTATVVDSGAEILQAQADLWRHVLSYHTPMALKCAVELGIPTAIHRHGGVAQLPDLLAELRVPRSKLPFLRRVMRLLVASGMFAADEEDDATDDGGCCYRLSPTSRLLVDGSEEVGGDTSQTLFVLAMTGSVFVDAAQGMAGWLRREAVAPPDSPFESVHGAALYDKARLDPGFGRAFSEGMAANSRLGIGAVLRECRGLFEGLRSLTDCGGGDGTTARAIARAFPSIQCTVLDLPHVISTIPDDGLVKYVAGDMFKSVPPAQAILIKHALNDWSDDHCVKALSVFKKAIPSCEEGGKVIIIDVVFGSSSSVTKETEVLLDMVMMCSVTSQKREEHDWRKIFSEAGFTDYKVHNRLGVQCVIEVYP